MQCTLVCVCVCVCVCVILRRVQLADMNSKRLEKNDIVLSYNSHLTGCFEAIEKIVLLMHAHARIHVREPLTLARILEYELIRAPQTYVA